MGVQMDVIYGLYSNWVCRDHEMGVVWTLYARHSSIILMLAHKRKVERYICGRESRPLTYCDSPLWHFIPSIHSHHSRRRRPHFAAKQTVNANADASIKPNMSPFNCSTVACLRCFTPWFRSVAFALVIFYFPYSQFPSMEILSILLVPTSKYVYP